MRSFDEMFLIWSVLGLSCVYNAFGESFSYPQPILPLSGFQPAPNQFNQAAVHFPAPTFNTFQPNFQVPRHFKAFVNSPYGPKKDAYQLNPPGNPAFGTFQPSLQISSSFQASPPSRHSYEASKRSNFNQLVRNYATHFIRSLLQEQKYKDAFNLKRLSKAKAANVYKNWIRKRSKGDGEKDPDFSAYSASQAVEDNYDVADSVYHMEVYGYSLGEFLYQKRLLTPESMLNLSDKFVKLMTKSIDENVKPSSESDLIAVITSCEKYLNALGIADETTSYSYVAIFSDMWYILRH